MPSFHCPRILDPPVPWRHGKACQNAATERQCSLSVTRGKGEETLLGLLCMCFEKNLRLSELALRSWLNPCYSGVRLSPLLLAPELNKLGAVLLILGTLNLFQHSDFKVNPALNFSVTSQTTKTGPTIMKKTAVSAVSWKQLPIFLWLGGWLNPSLPIRQHMDYIFSKIRQSLAAPFRFWKCMNEIERKCALWVFFVFACLFGCVFCFVLSRVLALVMPSLPRGPWIFKRIWNSTTEVEGSV